MSKLSTFKKYLLILEEFQKRQNKTLNAYDKTLQELIGVDSRQLGRLLDEISDTLDNIVKQKEGKKSVYRLIKPIDLFVETFKNSNEIGWLFHMAHDADPEIFKELESYTNTHKNIYKFNHF